MPTYGADNGAAEFDHEIFDQEELEIDRWRPMSSGIPACTKCRCIFTHGFDGLPVERYQVAGITEHDCECHAIPSLLGRS